MNKQKLQLQTRALNRQLFNPTVIKHHQFDCHIATAKQCGTHWIKYMLSLVLCKVHDLPYPENIRADSVVGHTKTPPIYTHIPQIAVTHSHPHYLLRIPQIIQKFNLPKLVVLVRDPRDILVSSYEKTKGSYLNKKVHGDGNKHVSFSDYLRGDISGKTRIEDIWGLTLFFNSWGPVLDKNPDTTTLIKYEDMISNPKEVLKNICAFIGLENVTDKILEDAVAESSRDKMKNKIDINEAKAEKSVNLETRNFKEWYTPEDQKFSDQAFSNHLKYQFGYDLKNWST